MGRFFFLSSLEDIQLIQHFSFKQCDLIYQGLIITSDDAT